MISELPDGLPVGRFTPVGRMQVWVSDEFPQDIGPLWSSVLGQQAETGLLPLVHSPCAMRSPLDLKLIDALRLEDELSAGFAEYRRRRLPFWLDPTPAPVPDGVEPWPHDPGPPFDQWPGLAPPVPVTPSDPAPAEVAARTLAQLSAAGHFGLAGSRLVLVPASRGGDALALSGFDAEAPLALLYALLRSWEDRFGAQVLGVFGGELHVSVARPPREATHSQQLALEHILSTATNIVDDPPTPFPEYAAKLVGRTHWSFWWD